MTNNQPQQQYAIGMVGLGVMGRNLVVNMADHGFTVAGMTKTRLRSRPYARNQRNAMFAARKVLRSSLACSASPAQ